MGTLFSKNVKYHISGPWGRLAFDIECENKWSRDLGNLLLASNGDNGILKNCWCLECCFSVRSTFLELAMVKIQMIFCELLTTCTLSIHIKIIAKLLKLRCRTALWRRWPTLKMTRQICCVPDFGYHCRKECCFYPVMFHINENYLKLSFYWYQYSYMCAIL